jgi:hypothetical protein
MNIFVLDSDTEICARYHADQHVVKMILESAQMLCTVLNQNGILAPYRSTHEQHPCTLWAGRSLRNWEWLRTLALCLNEEYRYRYDRQTDHRSAAVVMGLPVPPLEDRGLTDFAQAMPERYRVPGNPVQAYRNYYIGEKAFFATWTKRDPPAWFVAAFQ